MAEPVHPLRHMEYPGRVIIIGRNAAGNAVVLYAITGRSPSSQARRLVIDQAANTVLVKPTDEKTLKTGNPDLLVYSAIIAGSGLVVSNGKQTNDIAAACNPTEAAAEVLSMGLRNWDYEPDEPNFTPRISGCIALGAGLSIIWRGEDGCSVKDYFGVPMIAGKGKLISTYTGENRNPVLSFSSRPLDVAIPFRNAREAADGLYETLGPAAGKPDFRVAAAAAVVEANGSVTFAVKNRIQD
jgi:IMP cyclohydrolase